MKNELRSSVLLFLFSLTTLVVAQTNVIDEVIWVVGDEAILKSQVEEQRLRMQYEGAKLDGDPNCLIPEDMAVQKLLLHQAKVDSIVESPSSVNSQVEYRLNLFISQIGSVEKLEEYFGKSISAIREEMTESVEQQMVAQQMQQKIIANVKVTPTEVQAFYNQLPKERIPTVPAKAEVQLLTIEPVVSVQEIEATKAKLRDFRERVESGETEFSTLAILYSEDPETAKRGGELGFVGRGMLVPEFAGVAFNLNDPKKVSQVIETEYGFHIMQLIEKRGDRINVRHILLKPKVSLSEKTQAMEKSDSIVNAIRGGNITFEEAVTKFSTDKNTKMNNGLMANPQTGDSKFEYQQLPPEIGRVINGLDVGDISKPFFFSNQGKEVCATVKVKAKIPTHPANLTDDYQDIKNLLLEQKGAEVFEKWIVNKQKDTYIMVKDAWRNCNFKYPGWIK